MDIKDKGSNLVPGQGRPLKLGQLRKLAANPAPGGASPRAGAAPAPGETGLIGTHGAPRRSRRAIRRAEKAWSGALALGVALAVIGAAMFLDRGGTPNPFAFAPGNARPAAPDAGLSAGEAERLWALAAHEPGRFPALLGVRGDDTEIRERNARRPERLLAGRP